MAACAMCGGTGFIDATTGNAAVTGATAQHCPACGGRGDGAASATPGGGGLGAILAIAAIAVMLAIPVASVIVTASWWSPVPVRWMLERILPGAWVADAGDPLPTANEPGGKPWLAVAVFAAFALAMLIVLGFLVRRSARRFVTGRGPRLAVWGWGTAWVGCLVLGLSLLLPVWGISAGVDLIPGRIEAQPRYDQWWQILGVVALVAFAVWLCVGHSLLRAGRWAARVGRLAR